MAAGQAVVVGLVAALVMLQSSATKVEKKHLDLCTLSNDTLNVLIPKVDAAKKAWKGGKCDEQLKAIKEVKAIMYKYETKKNELKIGGMPGREILIEMTEDCDDVISTMKGIRKHMNTVDAGISCVDKQNVGEKANKMWNRVFRCGFGQRGKTLSSGVLAEVNSKALVGLRKKREAQIIEENELEEMPVEGKDGVVRFIKNEPTLKKVENSIDRLLRERNIRAKGAAGRSLFDVRVEHKCSCQNSDCKCCLLIFKGGEAEEAYSACLGLEVLKECKRKGLRIYVEFMGLSTGLTIMEGSSACYNFPSIPVSVCIEPYAFHFCPRRGTFRACLMLQFEVLGFKVASYNLDCFVLSYTKEGGIGLRLRKAKQHWLPQIGIINALFNWVSDIVVSQYDKSK